MLRFLAQRLADTVPTLLLLTLLVFALFKLIPGDYLSTMEMNPAIPAERVAELRSDYGLDRSLTYQYWSWISQAVQGEFGYSFSQRRPAGQLIWERLKGTLSLTLVALAVTLVISLPLGATAALRHGGKIDNIVLALTIACISLPSVLASILMLYFAFWSGLFPIGGSDSWKHVVLPSLTLAIPAGALLIRTFRLEMIEALGQPYILAARAKGLPEWKVVWHAVRNALNPLISLTGLTLGGFLSGAVVVEKVFSWPGLGGLTVDSILARDLYVALNCVLVSAVLFMSANFLADILLFVNDPRIRR